MSDGKYYVIQSGDTLSRIRAQNPDLGYDTWQELRDANLTEIMRVGREKMAALNIGAAVTRKPCKLSGHGSLETHEIINGVHWDGPGQPTIYPGTTLFLKKKPAPPPPEPPALPPPQYTPPPSYTPPPPAPPPPKEIPRGREITKDQWTGVECQSPGPILEVYATGNNAAPDFTYSAEAGTYRKLLSYSFSEGVDDLEGSFSFTVENEELDPEGKTVFDLMPVRSVVKIYEGADYPAFVGIIRRRHLRTAMTGQGVRRTIQFSGKGIASCIVDYAISLDIRIQGVADAISRTKILEDRLAQDNLTLKDFMIKTWEYFKEVSEHAGISTTGLAEVINSFIGKGDPAVFIKVLGKEQTLRYNVAMAFFNAANNVIAEVWRNILAGLRAFFPARQRGT